MRIRVPKKMLDGYRRILSKLRIDVTRLSPLEDTKPPKQGLRSEFAARWPELENVPWFPAIGDGAAANIGSGFTSASRVALSMGSTTAIRVLMDESIDRVPDGLWCYRIDATRSLLGGATSEGGNLFAWMTKTMNLGDPSNLRSDAGKLEPDEHGLTVLPFIAGERSPGWQGQAKATIHGISLATTPVEILRAAFY